MVMAWDQSPSITISPYKPSHRPVVKGHSIDSNSDSPDVLTEDAHRHQECVVMFLGSGCQ